MGSPKARADYEIRQGDVGRALGVTLKNADGSLWAAPTGTTAVFRMVGRQSGVVVTGAATLPTTTTASYAFASGDTDVADTYDAVFVLTIPGGTVETFPTCSSPGRGFLVEVCPAI